MAMFFVKRLKKMRTLSVLYSGALLIVFNAHPHLCCADSQAIMNRLGSCFGACSGGSAGNDCRSRCWGGYQMDLHPEILQEEQNRKKREEEMKRKEREEELNQEKPEEELRPEDRLKRFDSNSP
jgi:hypothetical protein